jgi:CHAT domain-containing protein
LVERYQQAAEQLLRLASIERTSPDQLQREGFEEISRRARGDLRSVLEEIRALPEFGSFMIPPSLQRLTQSLHQNWLAYMAATEFGGMTLLVRSAAEPIRIIWMPELTSEEVNDRVAGWYSAYRAWRADLTSDVSRRIWIEALDNITEWLWAGAGLGKVAEAVGEDESLILVPTGSLGFLPLHAAWAPDPAAPSGRRYMLDAVTVRYAPSGRSLGTVVQLAEHAVAGSALIVRDPEPVSGGSLPAAELEATAVSGLMPESTRLEQRAATRDRVVVALRNHPIQHFCCHAYADPAEPLSSGLVLSNDELLTLRDVLNIRLHRCRLTVLSACETGIVGEELPDEAVSLAAGFVQAGSAAVISSLWAVNDIASAVLMMRFYELWLVKQLEPSRAFRIAQIWLRDTTNAEKVEWCRTWLPEFGGVDGALTAAADGFYKFLRRRPLEQREFASPHFWGAFNYMGA